jgi:hypothetical protein
MTEVCITADHRELGPDVIKQLVDKLPTLDLEVLVNPIKDEEGDWIEDEDSLGDDAHMIIIRPKMKLSESTTMVSNGGFIYDYPIDDEEFLEKLCRDLVHDYRNDDEQLEEVIKRYNNHPKKENLEDCIEDITEGNIEWNMTVDHKEGFTNGYDDWIFPA